MEQKSVVLTKLTTKIHEKKHKCGQFLEIMFYQNMNQRIKSEKFKQKVVVQTKIVNRDSLEEICNFLKKTYFDCRQKQL